jgi:hypothetical protein
MNIEKLFIKGEFHFTCYDIFGKKKWEEVIKNLVVTVGRNEILDQALDGSGYTAAAYMGLISSIGWSAVAAGDTMSSHAGWNEAGPSNAPDYSGNRKTCVWSSAAAGVKSLSAALSFTPIESGTFKGGFIVFGSGASATKENTGGVLLSAGTFDQGDRSVVSGDTVNVVYSITLS